MRGKATSYGAKGKSSFRYSADLRAWEKAARDGKPHEADRLAFDHRVKHGPPLRDGERIDVENKQFYFPRRRSMNYRDELQANFKPGERFADA